MFTKVLQGRRGRVSITYVCTYQASFLLLLLPPLPLIFARPAITI
jgi:hypothetical protein